MGSQAFKGWTVSQLVGWSSWAESKVKLDTDCKQADKRQLEVPQTIIPLCMIGWDASPLQGFIPLIFFSLVPIYIPAWVDNNSVE